MRIIDTHLHLIYPDKFSYPWLEDAPAINRPWHVEDYLAEAEPLGIEAALHMEVDVAEADIVPESRLMANVHPKVVGMIAAARPEWEDFPRQLEELAAIKGIRGLRRVLHVVPDDISQTPVFAENLRRLSAPGLSFDLCLRHDQLPLGIALADKAPEVQFILDHCGVPDVAGAALDPWRAYISELARRPNVAGKISGIVAYANPTWEVGDLKPFFEHMISSFGWDRVVWGSDHPVVTMNGNLTAWVNATMELLEGASDAEKAKLLHANAERIYRI